MAIDDFFNNIDCNKLEEQHLPGRKDVLRVQELLKQDRAEMVSKIRMVVDRFVNYVFQKYPNKQNLPPARRFSMAKKLRFLKNRQEIPENIHDYLHILRKAGNKAIHEGEDPNHDTQVLLPLFLAVVRWFVEDKLDKLLGGIKQIAPEKPDAQAIASLPIVVANQRKIRDDFTSNLLSPHWALINRPELVKILGGVLLFKLGLFTDWWEAGSAAPYILLRDQDYINHAYTAELKYVRNNLPDWPNQMQAGLVLMEDRQDWFPNPQNVFLWGVKTLDKTHLFSLDELRQQDREHGRCQGTTPIDWKYAGSDAMGTNLPLVIRVKQEKDGSGWKYTFEVAADFKEPALFSRVLGPYHWPRHVGIFAKSFNLRKLDFKIGFQAFRLTIV